MASFQNATTFTRGSVGLAGIPVRTTLVVGTISAIVFVLLTSFLVYATWAAFQGDHYTYGPYLSPFYSPELFGSSSHAWFGPKPAWWPGWLIFSPALLILPVPGIFRVTCYYYRGAYYKAFWADPPSCAVGEQRKSYRGEDSFPLILKTIMEAGHGGASGRYDALRELAFTYSFILDQVGLASQ